jgi:hypothetical protein
MKDRLGSHYDPIKDPRLFPENIIRRKMARWREKEQQRKQKEKDKMREKAFRESKENNGGSWSRTRINRR